MYLFVVRVVRKQWVRSPFSEKLCILALCDRSKKDILAILNVYLLDSQRFKGVISHNE